MPLAKSVKPPPLVTNQNLMKPEPTYWYVGKCPLSGQELRLPRTQAIEHLAQQWMTEMATDEQFQQEGKMYGLLLVKSVTGETYILKAFSGLWQGQATVDGWVPPLPGRDTLGIAEIDTIQQLSALRDQILIAQNSPVHQEYTALLAESQQQRDQLNTELQQRRRDRQLQRNTAQLPAELAVIEQASKTDSRRKREFKEHWHSRLEPLKLEVDQLNIKISDKLFLKLCNLNCIRPLQSLTLLEIVNHYKPSAPLVYLPAAVNAVLLSFCTMQPAIN
jgi:tRNA pseudouridine32 synthase / 23S rRNA pseudouridine746 synthase